MEFFINEIVEREDVLEILRNQREKYLPQAQEKAEEFIRTGNCKFEEWGLLPLFVFGLVCDHTRKLHEAKGIPHEITVATLKDVTPGLTTTKANTATSG